MKTRESIPEEKHTYHHAKFPGSFSKHNMIHEPKHYLPAQTPLKDIDHTMLHAPHGFLYGYEPEGEGIAEINEHEYHKPKGKPGTSNKVLWAA